MCAIGFGVEARAAALVQETLRNDHVVLHLTGPIDSKDAASFAAAVDTLTAAGKRIDVVSLNSIVGQLEEGALIAAVIQTSRLATRVEDGALCASCVCGRTTICSCDGFFRNCGSRPPDEPESTAEESLAMAVALSPFFRCPSESGRTALRRSIGPDK